MMHGGNVWRGGAPSEYLDFSANLNPEGMPAWARETMLRAVNDAAYYPDIAMKAARQGLADYLGVEASQLLPTAGGIAAIELALMLDEGTVHIKTPDFGEYKERTVALGRKIALDTESCKPGDTLIFSNPNNPTGALMTRKEALELSRNINGAALTVDEAFIDFCPEESLRGDVSESLRVTGSLTKILAIPGVRLGYILADAKTIRRLEKLMPPWQLNCFAAAIAKELPGHKDDIARFRRENAARRERFDKALKSIGARTFPSQANFILCDFGRDMTQVVKHLESRHILVRDCVSFGLGSNYLRLNVRSDSENQILTEEILRCPAY